MFTIGIVTDKMEYVEHEIIFMKHAITPFVSNRLKKLFSAYSFDKYTDICITDETMLDNALTIYLQTIANHLGISFELLHDSTILLRLIRLHTSLVGKGWKKKYLLKWKIDNTKCLSSKNLDKTHIPTIFRKVWNAFLRKNVCPWIDADVDLSISLGEGRFKRQRKRVRLAAYYLVCRRYFKLHGQRV